MKKTLKFTRKHFNTRWAGIVYDTISPESLEIITKKLCERYGIKRLKGESPDTTDKSKLVCECSSDELWAKFVNDFFQETHKYITALKW